MNGALLTRARAYVLMRLREDPNVRPRELREELAEHLGVPPEHIGTVIPLFHDPEQRRSA